VAGGSAALDGAVGNLPLGLVVGVGLPSLEILAVEQLDEALGVVLGGSGAGQSDEGEGREGPELECHVIRFS
jgi:hypothetical protein